MGPVLYDQVIVFYTQLLGALSISYIVCSLFENCQVSGWIHWLDSISYEVYLVHYMFVVGPVSMFGLTSWWIVNCMLVTIVTLMTAQIIHSLSDLIVRYF